jgi:hypothetical protein
MSSGWSPFLSSSSSDIEGSDKALQRELDMLEQAVREHGVVRRAELGRLVRCKLWGPGRFSRALRVGVRDGRLVSPRRGFYGPPE